MTLLLYDNQYAEKAHFTLMKQQAQSNIDNIYDTIIYVENQKEKRDTIQNILQTPILFIQTLYTIPF